MAALDRGLPFLRFRIAFFTKTDDMSKIKKTNHNHIFH